MKTILGTYVPFSILSVTLGAGLAAYGCTTTAVNGTPDGGSGSSSSGSSSSSGGSSSSSSGGSSGSSSGSSSSGGSSGSSGSSSGTVADAGPITCSAKVPMTDAGTFVISDFSTVAASDAGLANTAFGTYPGYFGGTYFYPGFPLVPGPGLPGMDQLPNLDAGNYCSQPLSQNSFVAAVKPASKSWVWTGTVAGFSGGGFYIQSAPVLCVDASAYKGVSFTISGTMGSAGDAGTNQILFKAFEAADRQVLPAGMAGPPGTCTMGAACNPPSYAFTLPATPTTMTVHWTDLTGGVPDPTLSDPSTLSGIEWDLPWPCTGATPYPVNINITNVQFVTQ
jgi:hypothetical protein